MFKKGDTLIEVTIAIGIFSLIAITIATVMSSGTAGSQNALETLITRQEIDAQADALRFIHESYITNKDPESNPYADIWNKIISKAQSANNAPVQFAPTTCDALYNVGSNPNEFGEVFKNGGFIINTRDLSSTSSIIEANSNSTPNTSQFTTTSTYPRLLFANNNDIVENNNIVENLTNKNLNKAEGIYIIGVKGNDANIVAGDGAISYYDFYIRSCWYDANSETPTTISTLIRLSDAPVTESAGPSKINTLTVNYVNTYEPAKALFGLGLMKTQSIQQNSSEALWMPSNTTEYYYRFRGWCSIDSKGAREQCPDDKYYDVGSDFTITNTNGGSQAFYVVWDMKPLTVTYDPNGGELSLPSTVTPCSAFDACEKEQYIIPADYLDADISNPGGEKFGGWALEKDSNSLGVLHGKTKQNLNQLLDENNNLTLYAFWFPYVYIRVDVNVFKENHENKTTDFPFDILINEEPRWEGLGEFKGMIIEGNSVKIIFYKKTVKNRIINYDSLCTKAEVLTCRIEESFFDYKMQFKVDPIMSDVDKILIEPIWVAK